MKERFRPMMYVKRKRESGIVLSQCILCWSPPPSSSFFFPHLPFSSSPSTVTFYARFVYGYDTMADPTNASRTLIYYNARDGWEWGAETVGVSRYT